MLIMKCYNLACCQPIDDRDQPFCPECGASFQALSLQSNSSILRRVGQGLDLCWRLSHADKPAGHTGNTELLAEVDVRCSELELDGGRATLRLPKNGQTADHHVRFTPQHAGIYFLEFVVIVNSHWVAKHSVALRVLDKTQMPANITITGRTASGDGIVAGNDQFHLNFADLAAHQPPQTSADLSHAVLERVRPRPVTPAPGLRITLPGNREVLLVASESNTFGVGRGREQDVMLRASDREQSTRISRSHACIGFKPTGAYWEQFQTPYGTEFDGTPLDEGLKAALKDDQQITVARAVLLEPKLFEEPLTPDQDESFRRFSHGLGATYTSPIGRVSALGVRVSNEDGLFSENILMQRAVSLGQNPRCPITVIGSGVMSQHARISYLAGQYWIEATQRDSPVKVGGASVPYGYLKALSSGIPVTLGETEIGVWSLPPRTH